MADRYLLESSPIDGYLLEDGSGVLLLDVQAAVLAATASLTITTVGVLDTGIPLIAVSNLSLNTATSLTTGIPFLGTSSLVGTSAGVLTTGIPFLGVSNLVLTVNGDITTGIPIVGLVNLNLTTGGDLSVGGSSAALEGLIHLILTTAGNLSGSSYGSWDTSTMDSYTAGHILGWTISECDNIVSGWSLHPILSKKLERRNILKLREILLKTRAESDRANLIAALQAAERETK